jgi:hypothetical protein
MQGIQPKNLTNEELVKYAWLLDMSTVPEWAQAWIIELSKRLEKFNDAAC